VVGTPDPRWGEAVTAYVVRREGAALSEDELIGHAGRRLAGYKRPKRVFFVGALPRTSVGKVDKRALRSILA
jgi:acyl-CoA synthetase (AMP-forming)/AMP-acid ligase II